MTVSRFFRTPKGLLIVILVVMAVVATLGEGIGLVAPGLVSAVGVAMLIDAPYLWMGDGRWVFPDGALLTGLIVAMILSPHQPWYVAAVASGVAVLSKYFFKIRTANIFNPAAFGLLATYYVFGAGQDWWGALPEVTPWALILLFGAGLFITDRVNKIPAALAFLGSYYLLFTVSAFVGDPAGVAEVYRAPDLQMALFFAFFMVTDPPTSPIKHRDQVLFGVIVAAVSYAVFEWVPGAAYYPLAGLLVGNAWEAWRRSRVRAERALRTTIPRLSS
jgi:Na+-translocating ferredoxin:NAD+ oxidoreductase RnfD subunit